MKTASAIVGCLTILFLAVNVNGHDTTKLTVSRWLNLLRYAQNALKREAPVDHDGHFNRTEHVRLMSNTIIKYFFNDVFKGAVFRDGAVELINERFPVDFLIMLDSSASIGSENFAKALQMLTTWVGMLDEEDFSNGTLRVSMVSFSEPDKVVHEFPFSSGSSKSEILRQMNSTEYHNGRSTSTARALWVADAIFGKHSRANVSRVLLLATDGWSHNQGSNDEPPLPFGVLWPSARLRHRHGVQTFVVGIGDQINHNELKAIASRPVENHLFEVADYDMMLEVLASVNAHRSRSGGSSGK